MQLHRKTINQRGFAHHLLLVALAIMIGIASFGTYQLVVSHADAYSTGPTITVNNERGCFDAGRVWNSAKNTCTTTCRANAGPYKNGYCDAAIVQTASQATCNSLHRLYVSGLGCARKVTQETASSAPQCQSGFPIYVNATTDYCKAAPAPAPAAKAKPAATPAAKPAAVPAASTTTTTAQAAPAASTASTSAPAAARTAAASSGEPSTVTINGTRLGTYNPNVSQATWGSNAAAAIQNGPDGNKHAMLTFDDCIYAPWTDSANRNATPNGKTAWDALNNFKATINQAVALRVRIVIAPTGYCVNKYKQAYGFDLVTYARNHGQYVISHSYDHIALPSLSEADIRSEISRSASSYWIRPPYGGQDARVNSILSSMGRRAWTWNVSSGDWQGKSQRDVVNFNIQHCRTGVTCLNHMDANGFTAYGLRSMVVGMRNHKTTLCRLPMKHHKPVATAYNWRVLTCHK